jgi:hypothetical protein
MLLAFVVLAAMPDLIPARWASHDLKTLELLQEAPVNSLLLEQPDWSAAFVEEATRRGLSTWAVIRPSGDPVAAAQKVVAVHFTGAFLEGTFPADVLLHVKDLLAAAKLQTSECGPRSNLRLNSNDPIVATDQGVWPGVQADADGQAKAAPSGAAWIDTNTGFLRFVRASTKATVWLANTPPPRTNYPVERYLQAIGDAAMTGARWVIALDDEASQKLFAGEKTAVAGWKRIAQTLRYYEEHKDWRTAEPFARLAIVEDAESGALLSGGILDMVAVKHTPVLPVPRKQLSQELIGGAKLAVNVDPGSLNAQQLDVLKAFTKSGGTLLTGPPGWKFPTPRHGQITLEKDDLLKLDEIWKELNSLTGRKNLGARLFNVSTMLSNLLETADRKQVILHLVNYSDYPVENVTVHVLGSYKDAVLYRPEGAPVHLASYEVEDGSGFDIEKVGAVATLVLTR